MIKNLFITLTTALLLHLFLGWQFAVLGAILGGFLQKLGGWKIGLLGLLGAWGSLILWNYAVAPMQITTLFSTMSGILGNLPAFAFPLLTLILAAILGSLGGLLGTQIAIYRQK